MLAKCGNQNCSTPFFHLHDGKLFYLENDPALRNRESGLGEYFWLCHRCSPTMTLRLESDGTVLAVPLPEPFRGVPDEVGLVLADRKNGLLLRNIRSYLPEQMPGRRRTQLKDGRDAEWLGAT